MSPLPVRQSVAQRWTLYARSAAALAGLLTAVIFLLPSGAPRTQERLQEITPAATPPSTRDRRSPTEWLGEQDWTAVAPTLDTLDAPLLRQYRARLERERQQAAQRAEVAAAETNETQPTRGGFPPPWRYIGSIREGDRLSALIVSDMSQKFVQEGYERDGYTIARIEPARIIVLQGRNEHTLRLIENPLVGQLITGGGYPGAGRAFPDRSMPSRIDPRNDPRNDPQFDPRNDPAAQQEREAGGPRRLNLPAERNNP
ncbi:MAG: hypothetical protein EA379_06315 [Phycisphaerales bacterium]|nr:MAG: hypothetical protein EA379_06315 [Phycisphaerales bacterium]